MSSGLGLEDMPQSISKGAVEDGQPQASMRVCTCVFTQRDVKREGGAQAMIRCGGGAHLCPQHFHSGGRRIEDLKCSRSADPAPDGMLRAPVSSMTAQPTFRIRCQTGNSSAAVGNLKQPTDFGLHSRTPSSAVPPSPLHPRTRS